MNKQPVYPKEDPEYRKKVMARFYEQVKNTKWDTPDSNEYQGKQRGRKAKIVERPKAQPRPGEKYNWL
jgi:hypothetical protein